MSEESKGIDPELIPYLLAADEDEEETDLETSEDTEAETDIPQALAALLESSLLSGPDPQIIAEIIGAQAEAEALSEEERKAQEAERAEHEADLAAAQAEARAQMRKLTADLFARAPEHDFDPSLKRVVELLDILGDPQDTYPMVQVVGTNGKTSTARMIDALLGAFDLRVGRFTSPHLRDVRERVTIQSEPLSETAFLDAWEDIRPYVEMVDAQSGEKGEPKLSFFEILVVLAYAAFADYPVDVAVIEAGMGGKWDATSAANPGVIVITPIDLDHQTWLGHTLEDIAAEKAGAIKPRSIVVCAAQQPQVLQVIQQRCSETDSVLWIENEHFEVVDRQNGVGGQMVSLKTPAGVYQDVFVPLHGKHQAHNALLALVAAEAMMGGKALEPQLVDAGFQAARSPGRLEVLRNSPSIVVDSAHNPAGATALAGALEETFHFDYLVGVYSAMKDKNIEMTLAEMEPTVDQLVITTMSSPRAADMEDLEAIATDVFGADRVRVEENLIDAVDKASELVDAVLDPSLTKGVVIFGSVYLAGEATALLRPDQRIG